MLAITSFIVYLHAQQLLHLVDELYSLLLSSTTLSYNRSSLVELMH